MATSDEGFQALIKNMGKISDAVSEYKFMESMVEQQIKAGLGIRVMTGMFVVCTNDNFYVGNTNAEENKLTSYMKVSKEFAQALLRSSEDQQ